MKLSEVVKEILPLAQATQAYWEAELPKRHPNYPLVNPGEDDGPPPPEEVELRRIIQQLPEEQVYELILLERMGQGFHDMSDMPRQFAQAKQDFSKKTAVAVLQGNHLLGEYLSESLAELARKGIDVDDLPLTLARQRRSARKGA